MSLVAVWKTLVSVAGWLKEHESLAIWLEGIALLLIFIWDRIDANEQQKEMLKQLEVMRKQAEIMEGQLAIPHRAYLAIGEPQPPIGNEARFPIENYGHVAGRITSVNIEVIVQDPTGEKEQYRRDITKPADAVVIPGKGNAFALSVYLPDEAETGQVLISGEMDYDTGFKTTDRLSFVRVYIRKRSEWVVASYAFEVDFRVNPNKSGND
jgi:hypothetical protein